MEKVIRNVAEMETADRQALEHLIGKHLDEHLQVIISIVNPDRTPLTEPPDTGEEAVPDWWRIYEGLGDEEIDRLDESIRSRADLHRAHG